MGTPGRWQSGWLVAVAGASALAGYGLAGSPGAAVGWTLGFVCCCIAAMTSALVQYLRAGALQGGAAPPPRAVVPADTGPAPPDGAPELLPAAPAAAFWGALTATERRELMQRARDHVYRAGDVLCREGGLAQEVIVILAGWARVWVREGGEQRTLAFRGAGELVGERAALMVRDRSATVTAEGDVRALRVDARAFAGFLDGNPRVRGVLEDQVYRRQTERRRDEPDRRPALPDGPNGNCTILITDIQGFSSPRRTDADRRHVLDAMYAALEEAFAASGIDFADLYTEDRGDGALIVVPPGTPTEQVLDPMLARLAVELRRHNRRAAEPARLQLRAAAHVGPVQRDPHGVSGISIIKTRRLVDAPAVKKRVAETGADLAFVTSEFVYDTVVAPAPGFMDPGRYTRIRVRVKESSLSAWLTLEGGSSWPQAM
ncbi:cyclic nucleotide-binding domain-containing protein [Actinomadura nitritigenes]|uniref:cyclic nucleotide-binding domain-containing protein n=1 Tax=Actinomadura nitritigenes TaxID=134602 RepID=UPI003D8B24CB